MSTELMTSIGSAPAQRAKRRKRTPICAPFEYSVMCFGRPAVRYHYRPRGGAEDELPFTEPVSWYVPYVLYTHARVFHFTSNRVELHIGRSSCTWHECVRAHETPRAHDRPEGIDAMTGLMSVWLKDQKVCDFTK